MPEIAEVETIRLQLDQLIVNKEISDFVSTHPRSTRRHVDAQEIRNALIGTKVRTTSRHGKYLTLNFDEHDLNIHLRMSGRLLARDLKEYDSSQNPKHTHVIIKTLDHVILFVDPRTFGELWLDDMSHLNKGIDALAGTEKLLDAFMNLNTNRMLKAVFLDQNFIAGIGNIYADEICANAKVLPIRRVNELTKDELDRLAVSTTKVIKEAVENRGSSLRDESFSDLFGELGQYQKLHLVHDRFDQQCFECGASIVKVKVAGRSTYFCPKCQK